MQKITVAALGTTSVTSLRVPDLLTIRGVQKHQQERRSAIVSSASPLRLMYFWSPISDVELSRAQYHVLVTVADDDRSSSI